MRLNDEHLPGDLRDVAERLRNERATATALDLDRIKTRAVANAATSRPKGFALKSRSVAALLTVALMAAGTGGVIAGGGNGNGNGSASDSQYKPGKGCGDKNHNHARENECKKDNDGDGIWAGGSGP
jgi:hypothetical protein